MAISFEYDSTYPVPAFPVAQIEIVGRGGRRITQSAFLDTGADATAIPISMLLQIDARRLDRAFARNMDGSRYEIVLYSVRIMIGSYVMHGVEVIANEKTSEVVVGRDVLNQLIVILNGLAGVSEIEQ
ncbi:MAG: retroviral-like aspartic protease family protein [Caldilineaceae bacterium]